MGNSSSAPCVEYEDIIADQGRLNKDVFQKRSHKTGIKFSAGDVLFGKLRPYLKNWLLPDFSGVAVGDFWVLKPSGTDSRFLYYLIQTSEFFSVSNQSAGSKMPRADWNLVSQYAFHIPGEENEQQKIGSLFRRIDDLITLHQRVSFRERVTRTINGHKKTDSWEQRKLGEMGTTYPGLSGKTKSDFGHGDAHFVTYLNVFSNPVTDPAGVECVEIDRGQNSVAQGDVFFTTSSETPDEVGMSSVWLTSCPQNTYLNSFCFGYRLFVEIDPYYLAYMFRATGFRKAVIFLAQGISRYNISKNRVMEISVSLPPISEQQKIGAFFRGVDRLITLHQREYLLFEVLLC